MIKPIISIIIPVYNVEQYLDRCIKSLIYQKGNFEIICVNDGSPDNCGKMLDEYKKIDSRIKVFHKENGGVSSARNLGIKNASADYITFIDPDDFVSPNYFVVCCNLLVKNSDLTCFNFYHQIGGKREYTAKKFVLNDGVYRNIKDFYKFYFEYYMYFDSPVNKIYKKQIIDKYKLRFREDISVSEDKTFNLDYMQVIETISISSDPLYYYFYNSNGALRKRKLSYLQDYEKVFTKKMNLIKKFNLKYNTETLYKIFLEKIFLNYDNYKSQRISDRVIREELLHGELYKILLNHKFRRHILTNSLYKRLKYLVKGKFILLKIESKKYYLLKNIASFRRKIFELFLPLKNRKLDRQSRKVQEKRNRYYQKLQKKLKNNTPSIICNNCLAGQIYHNLGLRFNSPTINLNISKEDFSKFVKNLKHFLNVKLVEIEIPGIKYPVGKLIYRKDEVLLHFMHYKNFKEAKEKWDERKKRVDFNNLYILQFYPRATEEDCEDFKSYPYKNKLFITQPNKSRSKQIIGDKMFISSKYKPGDILKYKNSKAIKRRMDKFDYVSFLNKK